MRINRLLLSNVGPFPPIHHENHHQEIVFGDEKERGGSVDIIIGANGTGKSFVLHVIQKLFDGILTRSIKLNSEEADMPDREQYTVSVLEQYMLSLSHGYEDQPQHIEVDIILTQQDKKQLCYIKHRLQLVSRLVKTYSSIDLDWKNIANSSCTQGPAVHTIKLTKSFNAGKREIDWGTMNYLERVYIERYYVFSALLEWWGTLMETQGCKPFVGLWYDINTIDTNTNPLSVLKEIESDTLRKKFLDEINKILRSFVHFEVVVDETYDEGVVIRHVYFRELTTERPHAWDELGDGVRLFSALWISVIIHNRRDCILFFQEPEHHIAPGLQYQIVSLFHDEAKKYGIQWIITTHSPFFVTYQTIAHLIRCQEYTENHAVYTHIRKPKHISMKQKNLIKAMDYEIGGQIFFVNHAILVEGPDDHYFFDRFIHDWKSNLPLEKQREVEEWGIFQLNGKQLYVQFARLLRQFGLDVSYIGDRDNIEELLHIDVTSYRLRFKEKKHRDDRFQIKHHYKEFVEWLYHTEPKLGNAIRSQIQSLRKQHIYLLMYGSLESYLPLRRKGLEWIIKFRNHDVHYRKEDDHFLTQRQELGFIVRMIFFNEDSIDDAEQTEALEQHVLFHRVHHD